MNEHSSNAAGFSREVSEGEAGREDSWREGRRCVLCRDSGRKEPEGHLHSPMGQRPGEKKL